MNNYYKLNSNEEHPSLTNYGITEKNIGFNDCTIQLYQDIIEKVKTVKTLHEVVRKFRRVDDNIYDSIFGVCYKFVRKLTDFLPYN